MPCTGFDVDGRHRAGQRGHQHRVVHAAAAGDHPDGVRLQGEQSIGDGGGTLFPPRRKTLMFNGYGEQVASLYNGMDLKKFY